MTWAGITYFPGNNSQLMCCAAMFIGSVKPWLAVLISDQSFCYGTTIPPDQCWLVGGASVVSPSTNCKPSISSIIRWDFTLFSLLSSLTHTDPTHSLNCIFCIVHWTNNSIEGRDMTETGTEQSSENNGEFFISSLLIFLSWRWRQANSIKLIDMHVFEIWSFVAG